MLWAEAQLYQPWTLLAGVLKSQRSFTERYMRAMAAETANVIERRELLFLDCPWDARRSELYSPYVTVFVGGDIDRLRLQLHVPRMRVRTNLTSMTWIGASPEA